MSKLQALPMYENKARPIPPKRLSAYPAVYFSLSPPLKDEAGPNYASPVPILILEPSSYIINTRYSSVSLFQMSTSRLSNSFIFSSGNIVSVGSPVFPR